MEHALVCPQCNAPLSPGKFASSTICPYCGVVVQLDQSAVSAAIFHEAFRVWNSPASYQITSWVSIGNRHWGLDGLIAHGDITDVYSGRLARLPTELVILKILRDDRDLEQLDNEWNILKRLHQSKAPGANTFASLLPQPVLHGKISHGLFSDKWISIFRWISGFHHTFEDVARVYPQGIPPRASIWIWRRILEVLSFIHASGIVHGAVLPPHLLIQNNDHGVRLVDYGFAGRPGNNLNPDLSKYGVFYPEFAKSKSVLSTHLDIVMSARCVTALLGGDPETASLPDNIPAQLADIIRRTALSQPQETAHQSAWAIREELGQIAQAVFGAPQFIPIVMPA